MRRAEAQAFVCPFSIPWRTLTARLIVTTSPITFNSTLFFFNPANAMLPHLAAMAKKGKWHKSNQRWSSKQSSVNVATAANTNSDTVTNQPPTEPETSTASAPGPLTNPPPVVASPGKPSDFPSTLAYQTVVNNADLSLISLHQSLELFANMNEFLNIMVGRQDMNMRDCLILEWLIALTPAHLSVNKQIVATFPQASQLRVNLTDISLHLRHWFNGTCWTMSLTSLTINGRSTTLNQATFEQCIDHINELQVLKIFYLAEVGHELKNCNWTFLGRLESFSVFDYPYSPFPMLIKLDGGKLLTLSLIQTGPISFFDYNHWLLSMNQFGQIDCILRSLTLDTKVNTLPESDPTSYPYCPFDHLCDTFRNLVQLHLLPGYLKAQTIRLPAFCEGLQLTSQLLSLTFSEKEIYYYKNIGRLDKVNLELINSVEQCKVYQSTDMFAMFLSKAVFPNACIEQI